MVNPFPWNNEQTYAGTGGGSNRHTPALHLYAPGARCPVVRFEGVSIPGLVRIESSHYKKNGKWSFSSWTLRTAEGVQAWTNRGGSFYEVTGADEFKISWHEVTSWEQIPEHLRPVFRVVCPNSSQRLDDNARPV